MGLFALIVVSAGTVACSTNPGRPPAFADATVRQDSEPTDSGSVDAGFYDAGPIDSAIGLPDATPPPSFPFSGVWSIDGDSALLHAREIAGRLAVIVGALPAFPYVYTGTISPSGEVLARSNILERSGCPQALLTGRYDRSNARFSLRHTSCRADGSPFTADLVGAFIQDHDLALSGVFDLQAMVVSDPTSCFAEGPGPFNVFYGISFYTPARLVWVTTLVDVVDDPVVHIGRYDPTDGAFATLAQAFAQPGQFDTAFSGGFMQLSANDPLRFSGLRDILISRTGCAFQIAVEGVRVVLP